jgi:hypothetical protein
VEQCRDLGGSRWGAAPLRRGAGRRVHGACAHAPRGVAEYFEPVAAWPGAGAGGAAVLPSLSALARETPCGHFGSERRRSGATTCNTDTAPHVGYPTQGALAGRRSLRRQLARLAVIAHTGPAGSTWNLRQPESEQLLPPRAGSGDRVSWHGPGVAVRPSAGEESGLHSAGAGLAAHRLLIRFRFVSRPMRAIDSQEPPLAAAADTACGCMRPIGPRRWGTPIP